MSKISLHYVIALILISFALGVFYGPSYRHGSWKKGGMHDHMLKRFSKELGLSEEQKKQVGAIFEARRPQMMALHEEMRPKFEALRKSTQDEIRKILTPEQQVKLDELNVKMEERWKRKTEFLSS